MQRPEKIPENGDLFFKQMQEIDGHASPNVSIDFGEEEIKHQVLNDLSNGSSDYVTDQVERIMTRLESNRMPMKIERYSKQRQK